MSNTARRIFLSPPFTGEAERKSVMAAFDSGYVAPCGPQVEEFERRIAALAGRRYAVAVSSGTAALDLAMAEYGVDGSWVVVAPTLTFIATVSPAYHRGAKLVFVDCDATGNIDPVLLEQALADLAGRKRVMVIGVDLYGSCCDYDALSRLCRSYGAVFICDSAEAAGARRRKRNGAFVPAGSAGAAAVYSFNGNKIMTTSGGGALLTDSRQVAERARKRAQQSREKALWYEHREAGYNYRLSNVLAAIGLAQLDRLGEMLSRRAAVARWYAENWKGDLLAPGEGSNNWLNVAVLPSRARRDALLRRFAAADIEARPVWKPMHLQPVFKGCRTYGGEVAAELFARGVCLPSGCGLSGRDLSRIKACLDMV